MAFLCLTVVFAVNAFADDPSPLNGTDESQLAKVTILPVNAVVPTDVTAVLSTVYRERPDVIVETLPKMKRIAIRADQDATKEIKQLLEQLDKAPANDGNRPIRIQPIKPPNDPPYYVMFAAANTTQTRPIVNAAEKTKVPRRKQRFQDSKSLSCKKMKGSGARNR
ncbi:MAG: hypothetical protein R3C05_30780 [Pirellulaceae bacterium]